ncbi:MAG: DUF3039 domain-containing protein [Demequinaceae bacterium]|nr:DUF3039 domain-containing protein [Demequinaceae bacterium]
MTDEPLPREEPSGGATTIEREEIRQLQEPGDSERFSHYVRKEKILESAVSGMPVIALCGKVWIPNRDPKRFPICPASKEILDKAFGTGDSGDAGEG